VGVASKSDGLSNIVDLALLHPASSRTEAVSHAADLAETQEDVRVGTDSQRSEDSQSEVDALLVRVQHQDQEALAVLFHKYCRLVFSIGQRVLRSTTEAEDLVQDVFLYLWSRSNLFVAGKLSYNFGGEGCAGQNPNQDTASDRVSRIVSDQENFGELLYWQSYLESAFDELSEAQRKTLTLFFYEGYTLAEISAKVDEPLVNVRNHYYRGLRRLERYIDSNGSKGLTHREVRSSG
jgi:RNA polymerase sigma-70 factor (ECF subfamily)